MAFFQSEQTMAEQEGVIKYRLVFHPAKSLVEHDYQYLDYWHAKFKLVGILGQDDSKYNGLGFGNLSERIDQQSFLISGTQTGGLDKLQPDDYALVTATDIAQNLVEAQGKVKPSSESLSHAAVYALDDQIRFVFHVHSREIWQARSALEIPQTAVGVEYGTAEMAKEIKRIYDLGQFDNARILAMTGHQDGVIGFGATATEAGRKILQLLS